MKGFKMKTTLILIIGMVTLGFSALICRADTKETKRSPRQLSAVRVKKAPVIDGQLTDACWQQAAEAAGFSQYKHADILHPEQTIGRVCYDDENLYISMECSVEDVERLKDQLKMIEEISKVGFRKTDFPYHYGGTIEVFLDTTHDRKTFQQYLLHANGSSYCTLPKDDAFRILNKDYIESASTITDKGFNIEMSLPLAMLHLHPDTDNIWGFNLNRAHDYSGIVSPGHTLGFSSWNSVVFPDGYPKGFQQPEVFGELVFDEDFSRFYWQVDFVNEPQAGDSSVKLRIKNETGQNFSGKAVLSIIGGNKKGSTYKKTLKLSAGEETVLAFKRSVSVADLEAKYKVRITDKKKRTCYLGGTQTVDVAEADSWPAPSATRRQKKAGYITFQRPYVQPVIYKAVPKAEEVVKELSLTACRGEFEPTTFSIYPLRNIKAMSIKVSDLAGPDGATIAASAFEVRRVQTHRNWHDPGSYESQALFVRKFETLDIGQGSSQRFLLTVHVPEDTPAGDYSGKVTLASAGVPTELPLTVRVLPFELSEPDGMMYFMFDPGRYHEDYDNAEFFRKTVQDQLDHGMTSWTIYNWSQVKDKETGKFKIDVDEHIGDNYGLTYAHMMDIFREMGMGKDVPMFDLYSASYKISSILELADIYEKRGWGSPLFYVGDELSTDDRIEPARKKLKKIKAAAPHLKTTTALGTRGLLELGDLYDVWSASSVPALERAKKLGKMCWTYSCRPLHETSPAFVRSFFGQYPWRRGLKGIGLWDYQGYGCVFYDRFGRKYKANDGERFRPEYKYTHGYVFFEDGEIIPTLYWEAVREGIDDYRYMLTLKKLATEVYWDEERWGKNRAGFTAAMDGFALLDRIYASIDPGIVGNDQKYSLDWKAMGDMDGNRAKVVDAILKIHNLSKN